MARRARRLLPAYLLTAFILVGLTRVIVHPSDSLREFLIFSTFTYSFFPPFHPEHYGHLWFIGNLWWISILFPGLFVCMRKFGVYKITILLVLWGIVWRILVQHWYGTGHFYALNSFPAKIDEFAIGILCGKLFIEGYAPSRWMKMAILTLLAVLWVFTTWVHGNNVSSLMHAVQYLPGEFILALLLLWIATSKPLNGVIPNAFALLGIGCYSAYLWHGPLQIIGPSLNIFRFAWYSFVLAGITTLSAVFLEGKTDDYPRSKEYAK